MAVSYVGDRLHELAQGWLVATLTSSAAAVALVGVIGAVPQLLIPVGGVIAEQVDRRRLMVACQIAGGSAALIVGVLVATGAIQLWQICLWAFIAGVIWMLTRPAFKVMLTGSVPVDEVPAASALNSLTETSAMVTVNSIGGVLLTVLGLPFAFVLNALTYFAAAFGLRVRAPARARTHATPAVRDDSAAKQPEGLALRRILPDLWEGLRYTAQAPALLLPMLSTLAITVAAMPTFGLLAAIVHQQGGSLVEFGLLAAAGSLGSMTGAIYAGTARPRLGVRTRYLVFGLVAAAAVCAFAVLPFGYALGVPSAVIGFVLFAEAVWNTSRVRQVAAPQFQARLQALTTMTFTFGWMLGLLWGGPAIDRFGLDAMLVAGGVLAVFCVGLSTRPHWSPQHVGAESGSR